MAISIFNAIDFIEKVTFYTCVFLTRRKLGRQTDMLLLHFSRQREKKNET